jgi:hypothetical protein
MGLDRDLSLTKPTGISGNTKPYPVRRHHWTRAEFENFLEEHNFPPNTFEDRLRGHEQAVIDALYSGEPVPEIVLADYPDAEDEAQSRHLADESFARMIAEDEVNAAQFEGYVQGQNLHDALGQAIREEIVNYRERQQSLGVARSWVDIEIEGKPFWALHVQIDNRQKGVFGSYGDKIDNWQIRAGQGPNQGVCRRPLYVIDNAEIMRPVAKIEKMESSSAQTLRQEAQDLGHGRGNPAKIQALYDRRDAALSALHQQDKPVDLVHLAELDRLGRCRVADELWSRCTDTGRESLLHDEHPHVRSCAKIAEQEAAKNEPRDFRVVLLPAQEDQVAFQQGRMPGNHFEHSFETEGELKAYLEGVEAIEDEQDIISGIEVVGSKVTIQREGEDDEDVDVDEVTFETPAEAVAFQLGVEDAEGFRAPQAITEDDPMFGKFTELAAKVTSYAAPTA